MTRIRLALGALMLSSAAFAAAPVLAGLDRDNNDGPNDKPCRAYVHRDLPAPRRCYRAFRDAYGPQIVVRGGMVFRDRGAFAEFREHGGFRDYDRWAERQEYREREKYDSHYAENTQHRDANSHDEKPSSGGASYGHRSEAAEPASGGASAGHQIEKPKSYSGGASSH